MNRIAAVFAVLLASTSVAACSSDDSGSPDEATDTATAVQPSRTDGYPDLTGETLNVAADWSGTEQDNFEQVLTGFSAATGAEVVYTSLGNNVGTALNVQIKAGAPPNVALIPQPSLMEQLAKSGSIVPLSDDVFNEVKENYTQTWIDLGSVDGEAYGVWFKAANKSTMWYNVDLYEAAGVDIPQTWDEYVDALNTLTESGVYGLSVGADAGWPLTDWFENVYLNTAGPDMYDKLADHEIPWTDQSVADALTILAGVWSNDATVQPGGAQRTFPDSVTAVFGDAPVAATVYEGDFVAGIIADQTSAIVGENAKFYAFPSFNESAPAVMGAGNVATAFDDSLATETLMKYLASPEAANIWIQLGGFTSPNQNSDMGLYPDEISLQSAEELVNAQIFRFDMSDLVPPEFGGTQGQGMWQVFVTFYENPDDILDTTKALEDAANSAYGS